MLIHRQCHAAFVVQVVYFDTEKVTRRPCHALSDSLATYSPVTEQALAVNYKPGDIVISEGDRDDALYLIIRGAVTVTKGREIVANLQDGDFFGEMALLGDQIRTATVKIEKPSTLLRLRRKDILALSEDSIELKRRLEEAQQARQHKV